MSDTQFVPSGPVRPNQLYVSWRLHKALGLVARKMGHTREDIAETVLGGWIAQQHPEIDEWMAAREKGERDFMDKLKSVRPKGTSMITRTPTPAADTAAINRALQDGDQ